MDRRLNVAVATDTILYAPFYMALYGGDFDNTPWGKLKVNIIGHGKDPYFKPNTGRPAIGVDGFVTLCVFFGYADIGICDPSYIIYLLNCNNFAEVIHLTLKEFQASLRENAKDEFYSSNTKYFESNAKHDPKYDAIEKDLKEKAIKIIGGLIAKMAFAVIGNERILENNQIQENGSKYISAPFFGDKVATLLEERLTEIVMLPGPSTGNCVTTLAKRAGKNAATVNKNFGEEIAYIHDIGADTHKSSIAMTCDYLSIEYVKKHKLDDKGIRYLGDFVSHSHNAMFTGIIARMGDEGVDLTLYKSFLYAIDKNLYFIEKYLFRKNSPVTLADYIKSQLFKNPEYKGNLAKIVSFLVGYDKVEKKLTEKAHAGMEEDIDSLIYQYAVRLAEWKRKGHHLYYPSVITSDAKDLKTIYDVRLQAMDGAKPTEEVNWKEVTDFTLLADWRKKEGTLISNGTSRIWSFFTHKPIIIFFSALLIMLEVFSVNLKIFHLNAEVRGDTLVGSVLGVSFYGSGLFWILNILFAILIFIGVHLNLRIHYLKEYEKYVYDSAKEMKKR